MDCVRSIRAENISKCYQTIQAGKKRDFYALNKVSFCISEGERVGIIGSNGAGKSTLLSLISGFSSPTSGTLHVEGQVNAIMDIGTSVKEEATGRENLYIGGEFYGLSKEEIDAKLPEITSFIGLGNYLDMPVKTYSSGMKARLAFGIISFVKPEILIIDEVLGVGDADFSAKSSQKLGELCEDGKILLVVSHSMPSILQMTERCLWMDKGTLVMDGPTADVVAAYDGAVRQKQEEAIRKEVEKRIALANRSGKAAVENLFLFRENENESALLFDVLEPFGVSFLLRAKSALKKPDVVISIDTATGSLVCENRLSLEGVLLPDMKEGAQVEICAKEMSSRLAQGNYELTCTVYEGEAVVAQAIVGFVVQNHKIPYYNTSLYYPDYTMEITEK